MKGGCAVLAGVGLLLAGCGGGERIETAADVKPRAACPVVSVLADASRYVEFADAGTQEDENVIVASEILFARDVCAFDETGVTTALGLDVRASLGPAYGGEDVSIPFFVAILDPQDEIMRKEVFELAPPFGDDSPTVEYLEEVGRITIPLDDPARAGRYSIVTGFQLTEEQVAFLRERFGR